MQKRINELNDYSTPKERSPTNLAIKYMSKMSLKDLEITQLKEANQELKDCDKPKSGKRFFLSKNQFKSTIPLLL